MVTWVSNELDKTKQVNLSITVGIMTYYHINPSADDLLQRLQNIEIRKPQTIEYFEAIRTK